MIILKIAAITYLFSKASAFSSLPFKKSTYSAFPTSTSENLVFETVLHNTCHSITTTTTTTTQLNASVSKERSLLLDGGELTSLLAAKVVKFPNAKDPNRLPFTGTLTAKLITDDDGARKVHIGSVKNDKCLNEVSVPKQWSDEDAMTTALASISVAACLPPPLSISDDSDKKFGGKTIVLGGGPEAVFAARALALSDAVNEVLLVSSQKPNVNESKVKVLNPSEVNFTENLDGFDSILDTVGDETGWRFLCGNDECEDEDLAFDDNVPVIRQGSTVIKELRRIYNCGTYICSLPYTQEIVLDNGVFGGPNKSKAYVAKGVEFYGQKSGVNELEIAVDVSSFIEALFEAKLKAPNSFDVSGNLLSRRWSLKGYWENVSWPKDTDGNGSIRYGLPAIDNDEFDEQIDEVIEKIPSVGVNPFVQKITNPIELRNMIPREDSSEGLLVFCGANYCRKCKALTPGFTRLARIYTEEKENSNIKFAKLESKELLSRLQVTAVPSFLMFREGRRYGQAMTINKLPSKELETAVEYLSTGKEWDSSFLKQGDKSGKK